MLLVVMFTVTGAAGFAAAAITVGFVLNVSECDINNVHDMLVIQRIEHVFAVAAALY